MEILCRHREKHGAFQWRGKGKWRFMPSARCPVIANPQGEAIHADTLDCFTAFAMTEGVTVIVIIRSCEVRIKTVRCKSMVCLLLRTSQSDDGGCYGYRHYKELRGTKQNNPVYAHGWLHPVHK
jgi:hypothetical protein